MAANPDFKKIVLKDVELLWPRLDQTYRFNKRDNRTEPADPSVQGAAWSTGFKLPMEAAKKLKAELKAHHGDCASRNSKLGEFQKVFGSKVMEDEQGNKTDVVRFTAKKNGVSGAGKANKAPTVVGPDLQSFDATGLWTGTKANLRLIAYPTTDPDDNDGVSLLLDAVQILEPAYGGDNLEDDFGPARTPEFETIGEEAQAAASSAAEAPEDAEF